MENENVVISKIAELDILLNTIVDYYCFKNNIFEQSEEEDGEGWKKMSNEESDQVVPDGVNSLIENAFKHQLKKFAKD